MKILKGLLLNGIIIVIWRLVFVSWFLGFGDLFVMRIFIINEKLEFEVFFSIR